MPASRQHYEWNDGGRALSGFKGTTGDCVCRAIAIATQQPYPSVYDALSRLCRRDQWPGSLLDWERLRPRCRSGLPQELFRPYLERGGWSWVQVHTGLRLRSHRAEDLPSGPLIVMLRSHLVAVIDGVIQDSFDPSLPEMPGALFVVGYFIKK